MTTLVHVEANCADDVEVLITISDSVSFATQRIKNGQVFESHVHGTKCISVQEIPAWTPQNAQMG